MDSERLIASVQERRTCCRDVISRALSLYLDQDSSVLDVVLIRWPWCKRFLPGQSIHVSAVAGLFSEANLVQEAEAVRLWAKQQLGDALFLQLEEEQDMFSGCVLDRSQHLVE